MAPMYTEFPFPRALFEKFIQENNGTSAEVHMHCSVCSVHQGSAAYVLSVLSSIVNHMIMCF